METGGYECALPFDTDSADFARGFEAGRIWERLRDGDLDSLDGQLFHAANAEMVLRMVDATADSVGRYLRAEFTEAPGWMVLRHVY